MKLNKSRNQSLWRAFSGKPALVVAILLLCVAFVSAAVQADDNTAVEQQSEPDVQVDEPSGEVLDTPADATSADETEETIAADQDTEEEVEPEIYVDPAGADVLSQFPESDKRSDSLEPTIISETRGPDGTNVVVQINVSQDAFISSRNPNTAYGLWTTMRLGWDQTQYDAMRTMAQWNLSSIPANATINNATASVYQFQVIPSGDVLAVQSQYVTAPWSESTVTWHNASYLGGDISGVGNLDSTLGWKSFNITDRVRAWHNGTRPNHGLIFTADERPEFNRSRAFYSRQQSGFSPFLTVDYTISCDNVAPVASVNPLPTFNPSSYQVTWSGTDYAPGGCAPVGIAYYDVQYRKDGGSWHDWRAQVTITSDTFSGGTNGSFYEFRARAVDRAGNVQPWPSTQARTTVDTLPPSATVNALPAYTFANNFTLTWVGTDNLSGIANYDIQVRINDGPWVTGLSQTTLTSYHVTGVQSGTTYYFRARATDAVGNVQPWSEGAQTQTTVTLEPASVVQPFNPPILKPTAPITDSFVVSWLGYTAPGTSINKFDIYYQYNWGSWSLMGTYTGSEFSDRFYFANGDGQYGFEAVATNSAGQTETRKYVAEAVIMVDLDDNFHPIAYLPLLFTPDP